MSNWLGSVLGCVGQQQVVPRLVRLVVLNAAPNGGRNYVADYNALGDVIVRAVTMPADSDQEHAQIQWQGGGTQDPGNPNDRRIVTRSAITPKGQPITIKASLNGSDSVKITVRPLLTALAALNPDNVNAGVNSYVYQDAATITVEATTAPNTAPAWEYIQWGGAGRAGPAGNQRLIRRDSLTPVGAPAVADATIDQHLDTQVEVIPDLVNLQAVKNVWPGAPADTWQAYIEANETYTVEATTLPDSREAWNRLVWNPAGTAGSRLNRKRFPRTAVIDQQITVSLPNRPNRTITVNVATVEIEVNDTAGNADDLVQLKCLKPTHNHQTPCRARVTGTATIVTPVVITNPDGRLRFPTDADRNVQLALAADNGWSPFVITGHSGSSAVGDAKIEAHRDTAGGPLLARQPATVFWFDKKGIKITAGGRYQIVGGNNLTAVGGHAVDYRAKARVRPDGVDCTAPQITNLQVGIVQNQPRQVRRIVWGPPTDADIAWDPGAPALTTINVDRVYALDMDAGGLRNDTDAFADPLYDKPGWGQVDPNSLMPPIGCAGGNPATSWDTPGQGAGASLNYTIDIGGVQVATVRYPLSKIIMDLKFMTWMVVFDPGTQDTCPYRQRTWELYVDSTGWFGHGHRVIPKRASVATFESDASTMPIAGPPFSNGIAVPAEVGQGMLTFTKP